MEYRVHWKGYESDEDSWTAANQFEDDDPPVLDFYKKFPSKPGPANLKSKSTKEKEKAQTAPEPAQPESETELVMQEPSPSLLRDPES